MKLAVVGSRGFIDYAKLDAELQKIHQQQKISLSISGGAKGADSLAEDWAKKNEVPLQAILPDWKKYGRGAAVFRNKEIIAGCDMCVAFWDGKSRGTQNSINLAKAKGVKVKIVSYDL